MAKKFIRCHCAGKSECKLCGGAGRYEYDAGPRGYVPFRCPTCDGRQNLTDDDGTLYPCPTCKGAGQVDPAFPPPAGMWDVLTKILFGA